MKPVVSLETPETLFICSFLFKNYWILKSISFVGVTLSGQKLELGSLLKLFSLKKWIRAKCVVIKMMDNSLRRTIKKHNADLRHITNEDRHGKDSDIK